MIPPPPRRPTDSATLDAERGSASNTAVRDGAAGVPSLARCTGNGPTGGTASDTAGAPAGVGTWLTDTHPRSGRPSDVRQAGESMDPVRVPVLSGRHHRRRYPAQPGPAPYGLRKTLLPGHWLRAVSIRGFRGSTTTPLITTRTARPGPVGRPLPPRGRSRLRLGRSRPRRTVHDRRWSAARWPTGCPRTGAIRRAGRR